jgi:hypothetical protein
MHYQKKTLLIFFSHFSFASNLNNFRYLFDYDKDSDFSPLKNLNLSITYLAELKTIVEKMAIIFSSGNTIANFPNISFNQLIVSIPQFHFFSRIYLIINQFVPFNPSQSYFDDLEIIQRQIEERKNNLSDKFNQQFSDFNSVFQFFEGFAEIQPDIGEIEQKAKFFFQQQDKTLPSKIKTLSKEILLYLNHFDQERIEKLNHLNTLFGAGSKPEFPLRPSNFVHFIYSISDHIFQHHEKSKRYEAQIKKVLDTTDKEKVIHSNTLIVLNRQCERRISLLKQFYLK